MTLDKIYKPIREELRQVECLLRQSLENSAHKSILEMNRYLLDSGGKRIRPALVVLSAHAAVGKTAKSLKHKLSTLNRQITKIASSVELIHMASLIHDDVIDHAELRHNKPSVNYKWGNEVSIALGDYLYSKAFELIASCRNPEVLNCLAKAMAAMCEGELTQVKERDNLELKKTQYLVIVKKKTASLMASCCRAGVASVKGKLLYKEALTNFGLNFGIAFQVMDDYLDITSNPQDLGKPIGSDLLCGELTLPFLFLTDSQRQKLLAQNKNSINNLDFVRQTLDSLGVLTQTRNFIDNYINIAKENLKPFPDSEYKRSLEGLADFINKKVDF